MKAFRILIILFLFGITAGYKAERDSVYDLEGRLMHGDKSALFDIAFYFDSKKEVEEMLGYHLMKTTEEAIAKRVVDENCLFTEGEIKITGKTSAKQFSKFLHDNEGKIVFSKLANAFLITPLEQRNAKAEFRKLSQARSEELQSRSKELLSYEWVTRNKIDSLIEKKNPLSLLLIASEIFKERNRFDHYNFDKDEHIDLLHYLTGTEIGTEDETKTISWHPDKDYSPDSQLNLLIYFSKSYAHYSWDEKQHVFINPDNVVESKGKEDLLFELLKSKNDSIAIDAFTQLTTCNPEKVIKLSDEYESSFLDVNYVLPTFPFRFLKQIVVLTEYCRANKIDYTGSAELQNDIKQLQERLPFPEKRKLQDKLINTLSLEDITAFEYWSLIHEQNFPMTFSAGRILDIFYSKNWNALLKNKKQLDCYLKKSKLLKELGIIGICNNYLNKFSGAADSTLAIFKNYPSSDADIQMQVKKVLSIKPNKSQRKINLMKENAGNRDYNVPDLENQLHQLTTQVVDSAKNEAALVELLSKITYDQIGIAMRSIENFPFRHPAWQKYTFMERDWGFFMMDFDNAASRREFMEAYSKYSESQLYMYYLDKAGIDYKNADGSLDYDKIYDLLNYDVVVAFVGGGGGAQDNEVYSLVKVLELTFKTTLGYPHKLCNSAGMYGCDSEDRARDWMNYIEDKKLLKQKHDEPVSFHLGEE
jgi:hypothetical protein